MNANVRKTNTGKILVAVLAMIMVISCAAIVLSDSEVQAANEDATYLGGTITGNTQQEYGDGTVVIVDKDLTIPSDKKLDINGKLTINEGVTLTVEAGGQLILRSNAEVVIDGDVLVEQASSSAAAGAFINLSQDVKVNGTITLYRGGQLGNGEGAGTGTNGVLNVADGGSIVVTMRQSDIGTIVNQNINLSTGATFDLNGIADNVVVSAAGTGTYYTAGAVILNSYDEATNTAGDAWKPSDRDASDLTFTVTTQNTPALRLDPNDESLAPGAADDSRVTLRQFVLNIDGTVANGDVLQTIAGVCCDMTNYNIDKEGTEDHLANFFGVDGMKYQILPKVSVTGNLTVENESAIIINNYTQLDVSGTLDIAYDDNVTADEGYNAVSYFYGAVTVTGAMNFTYDEDNIVIDNNKDTYPEDLPGSTEDKEYYVSEGMSGLNKIIVNGGIITVVTTGNGDEFITDVFGAEHVYGSAYYVEGTNNDTVYITDFAAAVNAAIAAEAEDVYVYAWGSQNRMSSEDAIANGAAVVGSDLTIPDGMTIYVQNALVVSENATLALEDGATVDIYPGSTSTGQKNSGIIWVEGKVVDYYGAMEDYETQTAPYTDFANEDNNSDARFLFMYEVKKEAADESYITYTTLEIAISESQPGETINLRGVVTISDDLTIPVDVTVISDQGVKVEGATLTVNGVLDMNNSNLSVVPNEDEEDGNVVVNNYIADVTAQNYDGQAVGIPGAYFNGTINDDYDGVNFIASGAVAGQYSSTATNGIVLYGKISMGEVTFTQGEDQTSLGITVIGEVSGNVTLVGTDMEFAMTGANASFTGSVSSSITSGTSTVYFNKSSGATVSIDYLDDGSDITTTMVLNGTMKGTANVSAGTVTVGNDLRTSPYDSTGKVKTVLTVADGATLDVVRSSKLTVAVGTDGKETYSTLVVNGTLSYTDGTIDNDGSIDIVGTMSVAKSTAIENTLNVTGTVEVAQDEALTVSQMYVGDSEGASGAVTGAIEFANGGGFIVAYPASNLAEADIALDPADGTSTADVTTFYINNEVYMTSYASDNVLLSTVLPETIELVGFEDVMFTDNKETSSWYADQAMTEQVLKDDTTDVSEYSALYAHADPSQALVYVSVGSNLSVFIDGVRYSNGQTPALSVGDHEISVQVNPGFTGTTSVVFNGVEITNGILTITPEMTDAAPADGSDYIVLSVTGNITQEPTVIGGGDSGDSGMGLTDYLLIILVILIVVMAIMVAMRLMRS